MPPDCHGPADPAAAASGVLVTVLFLIADGLVALYVARGLQGLSTGAATSALSAAQPR